MKALLWCVGSVVTIAVIALLFVPDIDIRITEDQVRDAIDDRLPLETDIGIAILEVKDARVRFIEDGENGVIGLAAEIGVDSFGILGGKGNADTVSRLTYANGAFYLTDLRLDDFDVAPTAATRVKLLAWKKAVETFLDDIGEEIRMEEGKAAFEEFLQNREAIGPLLRTALDDALGEVAVYKLDGSVTQTAVWMALKGVRFQDRVAIATLSPSRAIMIAATWVLIAMIAGIWLWFAWHDYRRKNQD